MQLALTVEPRRCYERALDLDPRNADAWVARGAAFANQQQFGRAAEDFSMALGALPLQNSIRHLCYNRQSLLGCWHANR